MAAGKVLSALGRQSTFSESQSVFEWKSKEVGVNHLFSHVCVCCQHACLCFEAGPFAAQSNCVFVSPPFFTARHNRGGSSSEKVTLKKRHLPELSL